MDIQQAFETFESFKSSNYQSLVNSLLKSAIRYSRLRVDWYMSDQEQKVEMDEERRRAHNALITTYEALNRNMKLGGEDTRWYTITGTDRKSIGDFACLLSAVIGIKAR